MTILNSKFKLKRTRIQQKSRKKGKGNPIRDKMAHPKHMLIKAGSSNFLLLRTRKSKSANISGIIELTRVDHAQLTPSKS